MIDLNKIIKRLELIKNLISLEEDDDISDQIIKLEQLQSNSEVEEIVNLLKQNSFGKAVLLIEVFLTKHKQLTFYIDPEIEAFRFEAKLLEKQIQELSNEQVELNKLIHLFVVRHNQELGLLIIELLRLRKDQSKGTPQQEEAEKDFDDFNTNFEAEKKENIAQLTEKELKELKDNYRKASKLCHPDLVNDDQKDAANKIFIELNEAYQKNDLNRVKEILEMLKNGEIFTSKADTTNQKVVLLQELERLRQKLKELIEAIALIKTSETFNTINAISNWDVYFAETKKQLEQQLNQLQNGK